LTTRAIFFAGCLLSQCPTFSHLLDEAALRSSYWRAMTWIAYFVKICFIIVGGTGLMSCDSRLLTNKSKMPSDPHPQGVSRHSPPAVRLTARLSLSSGQLLM